MKRLSACPWISLFICSVNPGLSPLTKTLRRRRSEELLCPQGAGLKLQVRTPGSGIVFPCHSALLC